jgi:hypothetical protein
MARTYTALTEELAAFIRAQKIFFVATAPAAGRINLSPKGMDSLRVLDRSAVAWLNLTGSGNETAAHVAENGRMTLMFCAFEGRPMILRLYGRARVHHPRDAQWPALHARFDPIPGARQIFVLPIELAQTSCGMGVPLFDHAGDRPQLKSWASQLGVDGLTAYWREKNQRTLDGRPTGIFEEEA